ncbi:flagellar motor stator protein MotA [Ectobacillus antri]|jgi:chemotaxis protein MotA|uniref:Flagellar motor stator protein MotA n=1 Tax=Ectobacillus antri TaxID=2486280 RepID=A0ABT6H2L3_9BACI|nr:flagellar motor stator protein MotA [Ectobacillus antri]MDG4656594.1 flagellar motor stator protein MotA [Ectobacillus antri]MDG5753644.1 flagellar motor stator protein MotA [Ectobacillus antri]
MDLATIVGILLAIIAVVFGMFLKGADVQALLNPAALMIIFVGTAGAVTIAFPGKQLKRLPKLFKLLFTTNKKQLSYQELLELFVRWAGESRKHGILSLEQQVNEVDDDFIQRGMKFVIDGISPEDLKNMMEAEIEAIEERHASGARMFTQAGTYAPTLGVLGAVIGLVAALGNLSDINKLGHAISGAFIATIFGIFSGYVLWHPFANKLKQKSAEELEKKRLILECMLMLQAGTYPFLIKNRILVALSETERKKLEAGDGTDGAQKEKA